MIKARFLQFVAFLFSAWIMVSCIPNPREGNDSSLQEDEGAKVADVSIVQTSTPTYNIFVENSGSMQGFFNGNTTLKTIIKEFYDRIDGSMDGNITLNCINTKIVRDKNDISEFLGSLQRRCNEKNTKIDDILKMAMDSLHENEINLVFSDFCFDSPKGNFETARSGITNIIEKSLHKNNNLSVAIMKFDCTFDGYYYPGTGSIRTRQNLPAYMWAFGPSTLLKKVVNLPLSFEKDVLVLEPSRNYVPEYVKLPGQSSRMFDKDDKQLINVSDWKADRHDSNMYRLSFRVDLSDRAVASKYILDVSNYSLSDGYWLSDIKKEDKQDIYLFTINSNKPFPGEVYVRLNNTLPLWVQESNYEGNGLPASGQTLGIRYLIEGVFNAYNQKSDNILNIKLKLIKK